MDAYFIPHGLHVSVLVLSLRCTSVTLNTQKQAIDDHIQISQSNNHVFICLRSLMNLNQSSKFNKILKDSKDACEYNINQKHPCKPNKFFFFFFFFSFLFFLINESKWHIYTQLEATQSSSNNQHFPQPKVDIVLNVQTNSCENKIQVFEWKYKGKGREKPDIMTNSSSYFLQNG